MGFARKMFGDSEPGLHGRRDDSASAPVGDPANYTERLPGSSIA
jgi:hypothetical protein